MPNFRLTNNSPVFAIRESKDLLGISTNPLGIGSTGSVTGIGSTAYRLFFDDFGTGQAPVSYTHLTLPTICSV